MSKPRRPKRGQPPQWLKGGPLVYCYHYRMVIPYGLCEARQVALNPTANGYQYYHCATKCQGSTKRKATIEEATKYINKKQELLKAYQAKADIDNTGVISHTDISRNNVVNINR